MTRPKHISEVLDYMNEAAERLSACRAYLYDLETVDGVDLIYLDEYLCNALNAVEPAIDHLYGSDAVAS